MSRDLCRRRKGYGRGRRGLDGTTVDGRTANGWLLEDVVLSAVLEVVQIEVVRRAVITLEHLNSDDDNTC